MNQGELMLWKISWRPYDLQEPCFEGETTVFQSKAYIGLHASDDAYDETDSREYRCVPYIAKY